MRRDMSWWEPFVQSDALARYIESGNCRPKKVTEYWHRVFNCVAKYLGFNKATRKILWDELVFGNWKRLHTDESKSADDWLNSLRYDVMYCSDRWSLDRLTRCHWMYRNYVRVVDE